MSANLKCYDPSSRQVTFDLSSHTSRLLAVFGTDVNEKTHTFSDDEMGGGELFWYTTDPNNSSHITGIVVINIGSPTYIPYRELIVNVDGSKIYFKKASDITLYVGVRI